MTTWWGRKRPPQKIGKTRKPIFSSENWFLSYNMTVNSGQTWNNRVLRNSLRKLYLQRDIYKLCHIFCMQAFGSDMVWTRIIDWINWKTHQTQNLRHKLSDWHEVQSFQVLYLHKMLTYCPQIKLFTFKSLYRRGRHREKSGTIGQYYLRWVLWYTPFAEFFKPLSFRAMCYCIIFLPY